MIADEDRHDNREARRRWESVIADHDQDERDEQLHGAKTRPAVAGHSAGPLVVDAGLFTTRADSEAIQKEQDRWTRLERMGR